MMVRSCLTLETIVQPWMVPEVEPIERESIPYIAGWGEAGAPTVTNGSSEAPCIRARGSLRTIY